MGSGARRSFSAIFTAKVTVDANAAGMTLAEASKKCGRPELFNADPGKQCTSESPTSAFKARVVQISMADKGAWRMAL